MIELVRIIIKLVVIACICSPALSSAADQCDGAHGTLQTIPIGFSTSPGSSNIRDLGRRASVIGFFSFSLNGTCVGGSNLQGLAPVIAYIRHDGIPWENAYDFKLTLNDAKTTYAQVDSPPATPWVLGVFGYDGYCEVELTVQYCECSPGYVGPHCLSHESPLSSTTTIPAGNWTYHCIPQDDLNIVPYRYDIGLTTVSDSAVLLLYTRWGSTPTIDRHDEQAYVLPPQKEFTLSIPYPRYEHGTVAGSQCYWIGIYNPTRIDLNYTLLVVENVCNASYGNNCDIGVTSTNFGQSYSTETNQTYPWTYHIFNPSDLEKVPNFYEFSIITGDTDLVLYVRREGPPTTTLFDQKTDVGVTRLRVDYPRYALDYNSKWWVGIYNPKNKTATVTVNATATYCDSCSTYGSCQLSDSYPKCVCLTGYAGSDCSTAVTSLNTSASRGVQVAPYEIIYHSITIPSSLPLLKPTLHIVVTQSDQTSKVQFLLSKGKIPTAYDFYLVNSGINFTIAITEPDLNPKDVWYLSASELGGRNSSYVIRVEIDGQDIPVLTTSTSSTSASTSTSSTTSKPSSTSSTSSFLTTGQHTVTTGSGSTTGGEIIKYKLNGGAAAGLSISMLVVGLAGGFGLMWIYQRRTQYHSLRGNANFD